MTLTAKGYAGFWKRAAAILIDGLILGAALGLLAMLLSPESLQHGNDPRSNAVGTVVSWLYFALFESSERQATPGKILLGLAVTDDMGRRISFARATGRHFAKIVSALIMGIGFVLAGLTPRKQALHDMMAGTLVVNR